MELKDVKTPKQLEKYWTELNILTKEKIDIEKDLPLEEKCFAKTFFDKKTIVYIESEKLRNLKVLQLI